MRPKRPSWTSPLTKAHRPRQFAARNIYPNLRHVSIYSLAFQKHYPLTRACGVNFRALFTHTQTKSCALNTAPTPPNPLQQVPKKLVTWTKIE
jgi:hypothetical protein